MSFFRPIRKKFNLGEKNSDRRDSKENMSNQSDFKKAAELALREAVNWRADGVKLPAIPTASKEELRALFDGELAETGIDGVAVIEQLIEAAENGLVNNTHPNFYSWVQGSSHPVGVAADILTSAWGQNAGIYQTAPAAAVAEEVAAKWLLEILRLPQSSSLAFVTGATMASFICLAAARSEALRRHDYDLEEEGMSNAPAIHIFLGGEAHATILSDLRYLGFGRNNLVFIDVDDQGRMLSDALRKQMDSFEGPKIVIAQAGHINSGAFDPFDEITDIAATHNAWVHVDGAFGLWANAVPELTELCAGIEKADSWTVDGHKWLQVPYDSGFAIVKHPAAHIRAMNITASYLVRDEGDGRNPSQYSPELSRRSRGFVVWAVLKALGKQGVQELVARHCRCARHLQSQLAEIPGIRILNEVQLNQLAIAFGDGNSIEEGDRLTNEVINEIRSENTNFVLGARWKDQAILRISIISLYTDIEHMDNLADSIIRAWSKVNSHNQGN